MARLRAQALVALVAVSGGCAHWPWEPSQDWEIATSKRFTGYARNDAQHAATLAALEQSYAILAASPFFPNRTLAPVEVLLLEWPEFQRTLGARRTGATMAELPGKPGYGRRGLIVMYTGDTTTAGAIHRLAHLFLHAVAPRAPLWLHEGLASYVETAGLRGDDKERSACLGQLPQKQADIPLAELFSLSWGGFDDAPTTSSYRFTATSLVDYFTMGDGGKLRDKFANLVDALAEGEPTEAALAKVFPTLPPPVLQEKVREHRRASETALRGLCPLSFSLPAEQFAESAKARRVPASEEEIERLFTGLRMLPRRGGQVDWYPPEMIGVAGGQFAKPAVAK